MVRRATLKGQFGEGWTVWTGTIVFGGLVTENRVTAGRLAPRNLHLVMEA